jgi:thiamine pyrophosphokinase
MEAADTVAVITGAAPLAPAAIAGIPPDALVVAADGGLDHALAAGLAPSVLVGDLDSVSGDGLAWAQAHAEVREHPADKALTDTELAVAYSVERGPRHFILVAGRGDRLDHAVAAVGTLGGAALDEVPVVEGWWGADHVTVARPGRPALINRPGGTTFSVLALHGPCRGVTIAGARWPLVDADLDAVVGLGVSNQVSASPVTVAVGTGVVTIIVPGGEP